MSLINKALKEEQRRRHLPTSPNPPMMAMLARRRQERGHLLLLGFAFAGITLAACITLAIYFGSRFLDAGSSMAAGPSAPQNERAAVAAASPQDAASQEPTPALETTAPETAPSATSELAAAATVSPEEPPAAEAAEASRASGITAAQIKAQETVDSFSIQGIRKSGAATRVFMNGKIQKLGDVVDLETGLTLIGFTDDELIFRDRDGHRYTKLL